MKTIESQIKLIPVFFAILILFQGCMAYKSKPVTLEQAVKENVKTKIKTNNGKSIKFKYIGFENDTYFGVNKNNRENVKVDLNEGDIKVVKVKDKTMSVVLNSLLGLTILVLTPAVIFAAGGGV